MRESTIRRLARTVVARYSAPAPAEVIVLDDPKKWPRGLPLRWARVVVPVSADAVARLELRLQAEVGGRWIDVPIAQDPVAQPEPDEPPKGAHA